MESSAWMCRRKLGRLSVYRCLGENTARDDGGETCFPETAEILPFRVEAPPRTCARESEKHVCSIAYASAGWTAQQRPALGLAKKGYFIDPAPKTSRRDCFVPSSFPVTEEVDNNPFSPVSLLFTYLGNLWCQFRGVYLVLGERKTVTGLQVDIRRV